MRLVAVAEVLWNERHDGHPAGSFVVWGEKGANLAGCPTREAAEAARRLLSGDAAGLQFVEVSHE